MIGRSRMLAALAAALLPTIAAAQIPQYPNILSPNTVIGRLGNSAGPAQAIPFATLSSRLTGASTTLNSGNGQTAPGAMSPGNTYSFGATTDTVQMKGLGLGGAAPATGLEVYNAAVTPTGVGQGMLGASSTNGGGLIGQGSVYDSYLGNLSGTVALGVTTGTQNIVFLGTVTAASLSTAGTIAGSICATSGGLLLYKAGVNCYAVSGISVSGGKTLTVNNTITLNGTDGTTFSYPGANDTLAGLGANQTFTGTDTFSGTLNITGTGQINGTAFGTFATQNYATPPAIGGTTPNTGAFSTLTASTPIGLTSGGTNASTAAGARASGGLNVDGYTPKGDTSYTIVATDRTVGTSASLTAPRTWTLPAASAVNAGQELLIIDMVGGVTNTNTLTISRAGTDTINGGNSVSINVTNGAYLLKSDGVSRWTAQQLGAQATVGVSSINGQTGNPSIVAGTAISVNTSGGNISVANAGVTSMNGSTGAVVTPLILPQGRITLATGQSVMQSSQAGATTVYYTPHNGNVISLYDGTNFVPTVFSEVSQATTDTTKSPAAVAASSCYDLFGWLDSGTFRVTRGPAWTNTTTRSAGTALVKVNGIWLNNVSITNGPASQRGTYVGSICSNSSSSIDYIFGGLSTGATAALFNVWNMYNRVPVHTFLGDNGSSYTQTTAGWRLPNNNTTYRATFTVGLVSESVSGEYNAFVGANSGTVGAAGVGLNSTSVPCGRVSIITSATPLIGPAFGKCDAYPALGQNFLTAMEYDLNTTSITWSTTNGTLQTGLNVELWQ